MVAAELPPAARRTLLSWAARALGELPPAQVPPSLVKVRRFTPARRATAGAALLLSALEEAVFRAEVARRAPEEPADAAGRAALGWLRDEDITADVAALESAGAETEVAALVAERDRLLGELETVRAQAAATTERAVATAAEAERRLAEQRGRIRPLQQRASAVEAERDAAVARADRLATDLAASELAATAEGAATRARLRRLEGEVAALRGQAAEGRGAADQRVVLLLDALTGAAQGLRRELGVVADGPLPGDTVAGSTVADARAQGRASLDALLALPRVHLIVDGYNVTKGAFGSVSLEDQRSRLVTGLGALVARTGAEVTVVWDGQGRVAPPSTSPRGVRVAFTDPGVLADDVVLAFAAAEPVGRPVVVVSSDREVATGARARGAWTVPSSELAALLR